MKSKTAVDITKGMLGLVKGCETLEVKFLERYETDNMPRPVKAIQIGKGDGEMWIYRDVITVEVPSLKLVGGAVDQRKVEGYVLEAMVVEHNYPHEPDWADVVVQHTGQSLLEVLIHMIESLFGDMVGGFITGAEYRIEQEEAPWPNDIESIQEF
jgi:hypothetical protein